MAHKNILGEKLKTIVERSMGRRVNNRMGYDCLAIIVLGSIIKNSVYLLLLIVFCI